MQDALTRALRTLWQAAAAAGLVDVTVDPSWEALIVAVVAGAIGFAASYAQSWIRERFGSA